MATPWTRQSRKRSRPEYWSGEPGGGGVEAVVASGRALLSGALVTALQGGRMDLPFSGGQSPELGRALTLWEHRRAAERASRAHRSSLVQT